MNGAPTNRARFTARAALSALFVHAGLLVSGCDYQPGIETAVCPDGGTELTYENFGEDFIARECQWCHGTWVEERRGAPIGFTFDDIESVRHHASRIYERSAADNTSMPPGPEDPTDEERAMLEEWLACGAPSEADDVEADDDAAE